MTISFENKGEPISVILSVNDVKMMERSAR